MSLLDSVRGFCSAGRPHQARQIRITRDRRDSPRQWTVEALVGSRTLVVRSGRTLDTALAATLAALSEPRTVEEAREPRPDEPRREIAS